MVVTALGTAARRPGRLGRRAHRRQAGPRRGRRRRRATSHGFRTAVEDAGGEVEDGQVVLARNVAAAGPLARLGRRRVGPVTTLAEVAEPLVAVHGQSDQHRLLRSGAQRASLDRFGGDALAATASSYAALWAELVADRARRSPRWSARLASARGRPTSCGSASGRSRRSTRSPGEDAELAAEETRLGFADTLRTAAETAREALSSEEGAPDALATTSAARTGARRRPRPRPGGRGARRPARRAEPPARRPRRRRRVLRRLASRPTPAVSPPSRERRAALTALTRKYGETIDEVLAWAEDGAKRLLDLEDTDGQIAELESRRDRHPRPSSATSPARLSCPASGRRPPARPGGERRAHLAGHAARHGHHRDAPSRTTPAPETPAGPQLLGRRPLGARRCARRRRRGVPARRQHGRRRPAPAQGCVRR